MQVAVCRLVAVWVFLWRDVIISGVFRVAFITYGDDAIAFGCRAGDVWPVLASSV